MGGLWSVSGEKNGSNGQSELPTSAVFSNSSAYHVQYANVPYFGKAHAESQRATVQECTVGRQLQAHGPVRRH